MISAFDLVIFDCDGVLIDSEVISAQTLVEALGAEGLAIDLAHVRNAYVGRAMSAVLADYRQRKGRPLPVDFEATVLARLAASYRRDLKAMQGVRELAESLGTQCCVATSSSPERVGMSLEVTGLAPVFGERVFTASMVAHGKPAPDLFLLAAKTLGAAPARCLVIEDSAAGVEAGRRAGMSVWRFVGGSHFSAEERARAALDGEVRGFETMAAVAAALFSG